MFIKTTEIVFRSEQYKVRALQGTLYWNVIVNRELTSVSFKADLKAPRHLKGKKKLQKESI